MHLGLRRQGIPTGRHCGKEPTHHLKDHPAVLELADLSSVLGAGTGAARHMAAKLVQLLTDTEAAAAPE